jgi:hypothetical protein
MLSSRTVPRSLSIAAKQCRAQRSFRTVVDTRAPPRSRKGAFLLSAIITGGLSYALYPTNLHAEAVPPAEVKFEEKRRAASSKEENRDLLSSQHLQVKKSQSYSRYHFFLFRVVLGGGAAIKDGISRNSLVLHSLALEEC